MIDLMKGFPENVVAVNCSGHVTKDDYEGVLIPAVQKAIEHHKRMRLFYRVGPEFRGIDAAAVWDDIKVGFAHLTQWERLAVVTDLEWIRLTVKAFAFLIPGDVRVFSLSHEAAARTWLTE